MADPVSGIITIVTVSLAIIKQTVTFIQEANVIDESIRKLLEKLQDLHKQIREVESLYKYAESQEDEPSRFVYEDLKRCKGRLDQVRTTVQGLASRSSGTLMQRVTLKIRSERSKKEIEDAITDVKDLIDQFHKGILRWTLRKVTAIARRPAEAVPLHQTTIVRDALGETVQDPHTHILNRTLSEVETVCGDIPDPSSRRASSSTTSTQLSFASAGSRGLRARSLDSRSAASPQDSSPVKPRNEWVDFHFRIASCKGHEARYQDIRAILQEHREDAKSIDRAQRTPLHLAAQRGDIKLARILLEFGADINAKDSEPSSILDLAVANNQREFVAFLLGQSELDETAILRRNLKKFEEIKRVIKFREDRSKETPKDTPKKQTRKNSWSTWRGTLT